MQRGEVHLGPSDRLNVQPICNRFRRRAMAAGATMEQFYAAQEKARMEAEKARSKRPAGDDFGKDNAEFGKDGKMRRELKH